MKQVLASLSKLIIFFPFPISAYCLPSVFPFLLFFLKKNPVTHEISDFTIFFLSSLYILSDDQSYNECFALSRVLFGSLVRPFVRACVSNINLVRARRSFIHSLLPPSHRLVLVSKHVPSSRNHLQASTAPQTVTAMSAYDCCHNFS